MSTTAFSPGKVILSGEHAVVAGYPAVASTIDLGLSITIDESETQPPTRSPYIQHILGLFSERFPQTSLSNLQISINSNLPQQAGLGSSAALAHALVKALVTYFDITLSPKELFELIWQAEQFQHGQSSGLDPATIVTGGIVSFQKRDDKVVYTSLPLSEPLELWLIDSGLPEESRKDIIVGVQARAQSSQDYQNLLSTIGDVTNEFTSHLQQGQLQLDLLTENQRLLEELGVVGEKAQHMIRAIEQIGGVAKITGAGGVNAGSGFLLAFHPDREHLAQLIDEHQWSGFPIVIGQKDKMYE